MSMTRTNFFFDDATLELLRSESAKRNLPMSELLRQAVKFYLVDSVGIRSFAVPSPAVSIVKIDSESPNLLSEADLDLLKSRDEAIQSAPRTIIAVRPADAPAPIRRLVQVPHERMSPEQKAAMAERIAAGGADAESQKCKPAK